MEHQAHPPPLGHCPRDVINLKNAPTLGHSQAPPPLDIARVTSSIFQGWNKITKGWNKIAGGWNKIAKGWNKIAEGWNKIAKGWNKIAKGWNKIAKGWNKIAKGWNKIFGMGNWGGGGRTTPPTPPPLATGLPTHYTVMWNRNHHPADSRPGMSSYLCRPYHQSIILHHILVEWEAYTMWTGWEV